MSESIPEVSVKHLATCRKPAQKHFHRHQTQGLPIHLEFVGDVARVNSFCLAQIQNPLLDFLPSPVAGI